jgi:hypothetical protein
VLTTGLHNNVGRQEARGNFSRPVGALARVTQPERPRAEPDTRRRLSKGSADEDPGRKRRLVQGRKRWIGTAGMAWGPNPVVRRGAGTAGETTGCLHADRPIGMEVGGKDPCSPTREAGEASRGGSAGEDPARNRLSRKVQAASGRGYCGRQPWFRCSVDPCGLLSRASTAIGGGEERTWKFRRLSRENRDWKSGGPHSR